jgi:hypothetical protein
MQFVENLKSSSCYKKNKERDDFGWTGCARTNKHGFSTQLKRPIKNQIPIVKKKTQWRNI